MNTKLLAAAMVVGLSIVNWSQGANATIFATDLKTDAPPTTLGGFAMTPFPLDAQPNGSVNSVASPTGGSVTFSQDLTHTQVGVGWGTWSHGYTGDVYHTFYATTPTTVTLWLPADTIAFYFYAEPNHYGFSDIWATAQDGTTLSVSVQGNTGANGFGFHSDDGTLLTSTTVTTTASANGMAVGEFGIAYYETHHTQDPTYVAEPGTLALFGLGLAGLGFARRRKTV